MNPLTFAQFWRALGPGLLMAGAAIGVSHLVQSTRAGADYGWQLAWLILLINLVKYPFFEFGHRYTLATGDNLLDGYRRLGRAWLAGFLALNLVTAISGVAGVTFVTAALLSNLTGNAIGITASSALLMVFTIGVLVAGRYKWFDASVKWVVIALSLATLVTFVAAAAHGGSATPDFVSPSPWRRAGIGFLIALMGWMPAPIDLSVWQSLWVQAKERDTGRKIGRLAGSLDFNLGYGLTIATAIMFLGLGAWIMHGTGETFSNAGATFAGQLVTMYTRTIGDWSRVWISFAAFAAMYSTMMTTVEAYPLSLAVGARIMMPALAGRDRHAHALSMVLCSAVALLIIYRFQNKMTALVDLATTIAFLAAPVFAWMNYRLVTDPHLNSSWRPGPAMRAWCWFSIAFLAAFSALYLANRFFLS
jgi:Mn2+/Fe2+ NRAMP family transporter